MRLGVTMFATDQSISITELAVAAEQRGFDSVWIPEHTHIPTSRRTPPPTGDAELPEEYLRSVDPLVALAAAAALTSTIHIGTGVLLPAQRDPWSPPRRSPHSRTSPGVASSAASGSAGTTTRWSRTAWTTPPDAPGCVSTCSRCRRCGATRSPRSRDGSCRWLRHGPGRSRTPPCPSCSAAARARSCSARSPSTATAGSRSAEPGSPSRSLGCDRGGRAGRDPDTLRIVPFGSHPTPEKLEHFASIGVTECVFRLPSAPADEVLAILDEQARLITR